MKSSINVSKENNKENDITKPNPIIENIKSRYILSKIYNNMTIKKKLAIVKLVFLTNFRKFIYIKPKKIQII